MNREFLNAYNRELAVLYERSKEFAEEYPGIAERLGGLTEDKLDPGLAGLFEVAGPSGQITIDFNAGYGFTAIIVAFLGRLHPVGILLAGLLMALTYIGGEIAQSSLSLPAAAIQVFQGMLLFFLLAFDLLTNYRVVLSRKEAV